METGGREISQMSLFGKRNEPEKAEVIRLAPTIQALPPRNKNFHRTGNEGRKRFYTVGDSASFLGWNTSLVSADTALYRNLNLMKARTRDLARNNDYIRHFLRLLRSNVVGAKGFRFQSMLKSKEGRDRDFNKSLEGNWNASGKLKNSPSVCGRMTRRDMSNLWITTLAVDGEVITLRHPGFEKNKFRYASQFVDPALLDWQLNEERADGTKIKMGVEVDEFDRPLRYHFMNSHPGDYLWQWGKPQGKHIVIEADRVNHTFLMEQPGQTRGVSWLASPAVRVHMLHRFEEAVVIGSRVAASKMGFYRANEDYAGEAPGEEGEEDYEMRNHVEPGMMEQLPRGIQVDTFDPNYPPANLEEFEKKLLKGIASGLGVDYVGMANDLEGVNYSSIRAGQLEQREIYRHLQQFEIEHFEDPELSSWAAVQQLNPSVDLEAKKLREVMDLDCYRFLARGWAWVDPLKEVKAQQEAINARLTTRSRVVADVIGEDYEELLEEIVEEEKMMDDLQVSPSADPALALAGDKLLEQEPPEN